MRAQRTASRGIVLTPALIARLAAVVAGLVLAVAFGITARESEQRRRGEPLRILLGPSSAQQLASGEALTDNYVGNNRLVPDFRLRDRFGHAFSPRQARGKVLVLNFWTMTCRPCIEEMPTLDLLHQMLEEHPDIVLRTVSIDSGWDEVRSVFPARSSLPVLFDPDRRIVHGKFGTRLFPETWVVDPRGVIRSRFDGGRDWSSPVVLEYLQGLL